MTKLSTKSRPDRARFLSGLICLCWLSACATAGPFKPARLATPNDATISIVRQALRTALSRPQLELGVSDYSIATSIVVLPAPLSPLEMRTPAVPSLYAIESNGSQCQLIAPVTGRIIALNGVRCVQVE
jgi:hypothetical protein